MKSVSPPSRTMFTAPAEKVLGTRTTITRAKPHLPQQLSRFIDHTVEQLLPLSALHPPLPVEGLALSRLRRGIAEAWVTHSAARVQQLTPALLERDATAIAAYDSLVQRAIDGMRQSQPPGLLNVVAQLDRCVYDSTTSEYCDDPKLSKDIRLTILDTLHRVSECAGSYAAWNALLEPMLQRTPGPSRLLDLAAGVGGFALYLKGLHGDGLSVSVTDLMEDYVALAQARASAARLEIDCYVQDAMQLQVNPERHPDIITCTQSMHHFSPGMLGRMLAQAANTARVGVCFVDGERGALCAAAVASLMAIYGRQPALVHDTVVSVRRMYSAEELYLIAHLAPNVRHLCTIETQRLAPCHIALRLTKCS